MSTSSVVVLLLAQVRVTISDRCSDTQPLFPRTFRTAARGESSFLVRPSCQLFWNIQSGPFKGAYLTMLSSRALQKLLTQHCRPCRNKQSPPRIQSSHVDLDVSFRSEIRFATTFLKMKTLQTLLSHLDYAEAADARHRRHCGDGRLLVQLSKAEVAGRLRVRCSKWPCETFIVFSTPFSDKLSWKKECMFQNMSMFQERKTSIRVESAL